MYPTHLCIVCYSRNTFPFQGYKDRLPQFLLSFKFPVSVRSLIHPECAGVANSTAQVFSRTPQFLWTTCAPRTPAASHCCATSPF